MSKKQSRRRPAPASARGRGNKITAAITLALTCVLGTSLLAQVSSRKKGKKDSGEVSVMSLSPGGPSKEYIYAGTKLIATVEPTAVGNNDAQFISMFYKEPCAYSAPGNPPPAENWLPIGAGSFGVPNQEYSVRVTMINTGTTQWDRDTYRLGSTWGPGTFQFPLGTPPVQTNQPVTFEFNVTRPGTFPGPFNFQWQMKGPSGVGFFGEKTKNAVVPAGGWLCEGAPPNLATFVSQAVPSLMFAGKTYPVSITMNNAGTTTWSLAGNYKLGSQFPQDNTYWGTNRVAVPTSVPPGANITFNFNVSAPATPGAYNFQWMMVQDAGAGWFGYLTPGVNVAVNKKAALGYLDFNNDGKTDIATWRSLDVKWLLDYNLDGVADVTQKFYNSRTDIPVSGDYDGDGNADFAVLRPTGNGAAYFLDVNRNGFPDPSYPLWRGLPSVPVPGDYDGDGRSDPAVYNSAGGGWSVDINHNAMGGLGVTFGTSGDIPVPADYNRDGRTDIAVFRPSTGQWFIDTDLNGVADMTIGFGQSGDIPLPMDYNGDGVADIAVFRRSTGQWFIDTNLDGVAELVVGFGISTDIPVPGDYNGDGKTDIAVYRSGQWLIDTNNDGVADITVAFGGGDPLRQGGWILKAMGILP